MNVVVVGDGKVGSAITRQLAHEGHNVVIIDNRERALTESSNTLDVMCIFGNGVNPNIQIEAGVPKAELLIAATSGDEVNILCCLMAKKLGAKNTIARVRNPQYADQLLFLKEDLGLSMVINPEQAAAGEIFKLLRYPSAVKVDLFAQGKVELVEMKIAEGSALDGVALSALYKQCGVKVLVCAVCRGEEVIIPNGDFVIQGKDLITIAAVARDMERFWTSLGRSRTKLKRVMIVGGGHIAHYLTRRLQDMGVEVLIVEKNPERCRELCEWLPNTLIIEGNGTDHELLMEEGLDNCDAFVALTGIDEENIILSLYVLGCNVPKIITKVNSSNLVKLVGNVGLDSIISPKEITAERIVSYVRAMQNTIGSNVETLYKIANGHAEALEFTVKTGSRVAGIKLKRLQVRQGLLIASIVRGKTVLVPDGNDSIEVGDRVIVVTTNCSFDDLDDILQ